MESEYFKIDLEGVILGKASTFIIGIFMESSIILAID